VNNFREDPLATSNSMIKFKKSSKLSIGRVEVINLCSITEDDKVIFIGARPVDNCFFLIKAYFPKSIETVPTGHAQSPETQAQHEYIVTDDESWHCARNKTLDQLEASRMPVDNHLYVQDENPDRVDNLTLADRDKMLDAIMKYCEAMRKDMDDEISYEGLDSGFIQ